jgi:hypothetical protein
MVDLGVREKIQMQMVEEGWKRKWDNYRLIHWCDWRSCCNWCGFFSSVSPNEFPCLLPLDVLQMTR